MGIISSAGKFGGKEVPVNKRVILMAFEEKIEQVTGSPLHTVGLDTIQVNMGLQCNQACSHCHLDAGPRRAEMMEWPVMESILGAAGRIRPGLMDLTGGAPELNPHIRKFVMALRDEELNVQIRTNLTVFLEPGVEDLPQLFKNHNVALVGSMPCYLEENVRSQRGYRVYEKSVEALRRLNALGYGSDPRLPLSLVYNPGGAFLPSDQAELEATYRKELLERFGITFNRLLTITNMPLGRFLEKLRAENQDKQYVELLNTSFNPLTLDSLMCRHQISIGWDGTLYDCDFNLALRLPVDHGAPDHISRLDPELLATRKIVTGNHCFGCTAGAGSSCKGALA
jgi:radical SAM/Cys-rich protein